MEPFSDIDSMTIERFNNNFIKSKGHSKYKMAVLGVWSVNVKLRVKFRTIDPDNQQMYRMVIRGLSHNRRRPESDRFVVGSESDSLTRRNITGDEDVNWLGITWKKE